MSLWETEEIERKVRKVLSGAKGRSHHFGRPYLTAYQLAIEFKQQYPQTVKRLGGWSVGGLGDGPGERLARYLARELSRRIKRGEITTVEGARLGNTHQAGISYYHSSGTVTSSLIGKGQALSMFRLRPRRQNNSIGVGQPRPSGAGAPETGGGGG